MGCGGALAAEDLSELILREGYRCLQGKTLNGYKILKPLGQGGMGSVFLAVQVKLRRRVALKVLPPKAVEREGSLRRFEREAQSLARLEHPGIVAVHDLFQAQGLICIAMSYANGGTVRHLIKKRGSINENWAADIICQAAAALAAAAKKGIVHRDIKPANLLMMDNGQVKVADFGLVKSQKEGSGLTISGTVMGTPTYMAPEQIRDCRNADHRSDLYALGCVLYELLSGKPPFASKDVTKVLLAQLEEAPDLDKLKVSKTMRRALERLLAKDPALRFRDGSATIRALKSLSRRERVGKQSSGKTSRARRPSPLAELETVHEQPPEVSSNAPTIEEAPEPVGTPASARQRKLEITMAGRQARARRWPWLLLLVLIVAAVGVVSSRPEWLGVRWEAARHRAISARNAWLRQGAAHSADQDDSALEWLMQGDGWVVEGRHRQALEAYQRSESLYLHTRP